MDGPDIPGCPVRAVCGRCGGALREPAASRNAAGRDRAADGRGRADTSPGQDPSCLLQGQQHLVYVPGVYISSPASAEQAEGCEFHVVPARDEPGEADRERPGGPSLAAAPATE